ncbi:MAG: methionine--tRNA ligase, partial [Candidatus Eremiobacteraeota bacterium]|nr:methionine--tRNA ligase [Candidatus Eremiobacteraeota bacterium]
GLRWLAIMLAPIMPVKTREMWQQLGLQTGIEDDWATSLTWGRLAANTQTTVGDALFPRLETLSE